MLRYVADFLLPLYGQRKIGPSAFPKGWPTCNKSSDLYNDMATTASLLADVGTRVLSQQHRSSRDRRLAGATPWSASSRA